MNHDLSFKSSLAGSGRLIKFIAVFLLASGLICAQQAPINDPLLEKNPSEAKEARIKAKQFVPAASLNEALISASHKDAAREKYLKQAREFLDQPNTAVNAADNFGRTPLHWAVIGAVDADSKLRGIYADVIELLIAKGADINAADIYGNTPLDYQEYSGAEELREILLENGAADGNNPNARLGALISRLAASANAGNLDAVRSDLAGDLPLSTVIPVKLTGTVSSRTSRIGDAVSAIVSAPVIVGNRVIIAPGAKIEGTILFVRKSLNRFERSQLILGFSNLVDESGSKTRLSLRLTEIDNARETIENNRIIGVSFPNNALTQRKVSWGVKLVGRAFPAFGYVLEASTLVYDKKFDREIRYPAGTDMSLEVQLPSQVTSPVNAQGFPVFAPAADLVALVNAQPSRVTMRNGSPVDVTNVLFLGSQAQIEAAFHTAGWDEASALSKKSGLETFAAILFKQGYDRAPFSDLYLNNQPPALTYQKQLNTFAKRNHIRIWKIGTYAGQDAWVGAATHDIGMGINRDKYKLHWFHTVDIRVDGERTKIMNDLLFTGGAKSYALIDRPALPKHNETADGTPRDTDGKMLVLKLN